MEGGRGRRRIELRFAFLPKAIQLVVDEEMKVDIGSIARAFGLDPNTLKLNGYFISRGADLLASSVTWKSLLSFFSARGLPTGAAAAAIVVHGKLPKIGSKRSHDDNAREMCYVRDSKRPQHKHCSFPGQVDSQEHSGLCLKRRWPLEDESSPKRTRADSDEAVSGIREKKSGTLKIGRFPCSIISKNLKRMRIDEIVAAPPLKKLLR